jgi:putative FmdB family regulatory protein
MPLYEYLCDACGHRFEVIQKFSDAPLELCPKCGGRVHKLQSAPAFQFKGTGWYVTDYAKKQGAGDKPEGSAKDAGTDSAANADKGEKVEKTEKTEKTGKTEKTAPAETSPPPPSESR